MRIMETDTPDNSIAKLKHYDEGEHIRLTFQWPSAIEQVYIFKTGETFDITAASEKEAKLFTLQEYRKQAGFIDRKTPGMHTYRIYPFIRDAEEDIAVVQADGANCVTCLTGQIDIQFHMTVQTKWFSGNKTNIITLLSHSYIEKDVLCYVKQAAHYPTDPQDGVVYFFGEALQPDIPYVCHITTKKDEFIRIFIYDPDKAPLYRLSRREQGKK